MSLGAVIYRPASTTGLAGALGVWAEQIRARRLERESDALADTVAEFQRRPARRDDAVISPEARRLLDDEREQELPPREAEELGEGEQQTVRELESRDREIRAHEQAHKAAAGNLAVGGPSYTFQTGPDGKRYAIGGEVKIRLQSGRTPEETMRNMERAIRAANAPESPSSADRAVAAKASQLLAEARRDANESDEEPGQRRPAGIDVIA